MEFNIKEYANGAMTIVPSDPNLTMKMVIKGAEPTLEYTVEAPHDFQENVHKYNLKKVSKNGKNSIFVEPKKAIGKP